MFKNIEISEINKKAVLKSLIVPLATLYFVLFLLGLYQHGLMSLFYHGFIFLYRGAIIGLPAILVITILERLILGTKSNEKTVVALFLLEMLIPFVVVFFFLSGKDLEGSLIVLGSILFGQFLRWVYLHLSGKMFNSAKLPSSKV